MSVQEALRPDVSVITVKDPATRLLDLVAGWANFVEDTEDHDPDIVRSANLHILLQEAGEYVAQLDGVSNSDQEALIRSFIERHIMPLLLARLAS